MSVDVRFHEVVKEFGPVRVLHGVSFSLHWRKRCRQVNLDEDSGGV